MKKNYSKVLVVYKPTHYDRLMAQHLVQKGAPANIRNYRNNHDEHLRTLDKVYAALEEGGFHYLSVHRDIITSVKGFDWVITVGGDGTFLKCSHLVKEELIMGVNSAPEFSVGALCSVTPEKARQKILDVSRGKIKIRTFDRLRASVNRKKILAKSVNDFLFANNSPGATSRYGLKIGPRKEIQKSSGIWIATTQGSTAAIGAAGGKKLKVGSDFFQYVIREPYFFPGRKKYGLLSGVLKKNEKLVIDNQMINASLFVDGVQEQIPLQFGDEVVIELLKNDLKVL